MVGGSCFLSGGRETTVREQRKTTVSRFRLMEELTYFGPMVLVSPHTNGGAVLSASARWDSYLNTFTKYCLNVSGCSTKSLYFRCI